MAHKIHRTAPQRTCTKKYSHYRSFKKYLMTDFNQRCGYCDDDDSHTGGWRFYQIDHFHPHSKGGAEHSYENLVYSCSYCNRAKSNEWRSSEGFIDPCKIEYSDIIYRDQTGEIVHNGSAQAKYIHESLLLSLSRHQIIWQINRLVELKEKFRALSDQGKTEFDSDLLEIYKSLDDWVTALRKGEQ